MDKQTAIDLLDNLIGMVEDNHESDYDTAIKMGIDALQSNAPNALSTLDCVERQAAIDALNRHLDTIPVANNNTMEMIRRSEVMDCRGIINGLPSAQPNLQPTCNQLATDCIERQAAIESADKIISRDDSGNNDVVKAMTAWKEFIKALPSVQPDDAALHESCTDCPLYDHDRHNCPRFNKVIPTAIRDAQTGEVARDIATIIENEKDMRVILANGQTGWIPVTDRLPEDGVTVWVTIKGHDVIKCEEGETLEQAIARISKIRWVTQGYWSENEHGWNDPSFGCPLMVQPIAWMPIDTPEPWQGGQDEQVNRR